jgi:two-component system response regulator PilR (NtrC family)
LFGVAPRELANSIVDLDALHAASEAARKVVASAPPGELPTDLVAYLDQVERDILVRALEEHRFNRTAAGASLGLSLRQMRYRMARLGVNVADHVGERGESSY